MDAFDNTSYFALRRSAESDANGWWAAVRARRDKPPAIAALLAGRGRVEVNQWDATEALEWAESIDGWAELGRKPVWVYPRDPRAAGPSYG
jgi:hypothetical protein